MDHAVGKAVMQCRYHKLLASLTVAAGVVCLVGAIPSTYAGVLGNGGTQNAGSTTLPDGGASFWLLALGSTGLAIAARKRFFKR